MNIRFATFLAAIAAVAGSAAALPKVHPTVHRTLQQEGKANLIVSLGDGTESTLESVREAAYATREAKVQALATKLQSAHAKRAGEVTKMLAQESSSAQPLYSDFKPLWISGELFIEGATYGLVEKLAGLDSVSGIREEVVATATRAVTEPALEESTKESITKQWNIEKIEAPKVWGDGNIGQGVLVASISSGARATHEAIARNFIGAERGWFDPISNSSTPFDNGGMGTHAIGVIAGANGYGVAPGANWAACKGCTEVNCPERYLTACAQWILCPPVGVNGTASATSSKCGPSPRVVHNSWYSYQGDAFFKPSTDAWAAAGIVGIFQSGDSGPQCGSVLSPGDYYNSISVGSISNINTLSAFSGKGPSRDKVIKPDLLAPGSRVLSASNATDSSYFSKSSTSIAAAHVAGTVALMLAANPNLDYGSVRSQLLTTTTQTGLAQQYGSNYTCGGTTDNNWPNNQFGNGLLNALNAYEGFRP